MNELLKIRKVSIYSSWLSRLHPLEWLLAYGVFPVGEFFPAMEIDGFAEAEDICVEDFAFRFLQEGVELRNHGAEEITHVAGNGVVHGVARVL